jgi:hypothetical protein
MVFRAARGKNRGRDEGEQSMLYTRGTFAALAVALLLGNAGGASAQGIFKFKLEPGTKLLYESEFSHKVETRAGQETLVSRSRLTQLRQWHVRNVDALGVATIELTVLKMKLERNDPDSKALIFDSTDPDKSDPQLTAQLSKVVGKPIQRVQLAANGVVKASQNLSESKSIFPELPFQITVADEYPRRGLKWQRDFAVTLDPPLGKGEAFKASQVCKVDELTDDKMVVLAETSLESEPTNVGAKMALHQFLPKGKVTLDLKRGLMLESEMTIDKTIDNFEGVNSSYRYTSKAVEKLVDESVQQARKEQ